MSPDLVKIIAQRESLYQGSSGELSNQSKNSIIREMKKSLLDSDHEDDNRIYTELSPTLKRKKKVEQGLLENRKWKSTFKIKLTLCQKIQILIQNKTYFYLLMASFFRFMGGYTIGVWGKNYFSNAYPDRENEFAITYFLILIFGSVPSELIGGYIGDKYES